MNDTNETRLGWAGLAAVLAVVALGAVLMVEVGIPAARYLAFTAVEGDPLNDWLTHVPARLRPALQAVGDVLAAVRPKRPRRIVFESMTAICARYGYERAAQRDGAWLCVRQEGDVMEWAPLRPAE